MKQKKIVVKYKSLWITATVEQKNEYKLKLDQAYDLFFNEVQITMLKINPERK